MKIVITGAKGQVGSELVKSAVARLHRVLAFDSQSLDITNFSAVREILHREKPNVVINAAAYTAVDRAESEPFLAASVNVDGPRYLAIVCSELGIPLLHISTDYVFDGNKVGDYVESDMPAPSNIYGQTKLDGELAILGGLAKYIILRVSWVFGENGNNFVKTMLRLAESRNELGVVDDQYGAPTSAVSIANTLLDIVAHPEFGESEFLWGIYHLPANPGVTWHGFAEVIFTQAKSVGLINKKITVNAITSDQFPTPVKRPTNSKLGSEKLSTLLMISECDWKADLNEMLKVNCPPIK
jgi:dTDP-4-dehydrorhamnose reductase